MAKLTPRQLAGTRLLAALMIQALRAKHQPVTADDQAKAIAWLESNDEGFASLHTACEQIAGTFERIPELAANYAFPSDAVVWREFVKEAADAPVEAHTDALLSRLEQGLYACDKYMQRQNGVVVSPAAVENDQLDVGPSNDGPQL